jgi:hypothetical protein
MRGVVVEGYTQDFQHWNAIQNRYESKRKDITMSKRAYARLLRDAAKEMADYGIDWSLYNPPVLIVASNLDDGGIGHVEWTHKTKNFSVMLTEIWFTRATGRIDQCGSNYGNLCS